MNKEMRANVVVNLIRTITMTLLSFITFPVVCRLLGDSILGSFSWASSFIYYFIVLSKISIPNIAVRECAKYKNDPIKLSMKVQEFFITQSITTLASFGFMCLIVFTVPSFQNELNQSLIFILSLNFLTSVFAFEWVFMALEKQTFIAIRSIIILTIVDILILAFVKHPDDVYTYAFITTLTTTLTVLTNLFYLPKLVKFKKVGKYNFKQYLPSLLILFGISFSLAIYNKTDTFILGLIDETKKSVGSYTVGIKGVDIVIGLFTSLSTVFMPKASQYAANNDEEKLTKLNIYSTNICLLIVTLIIGLMICLSTPITSLISGNYQNNGYNDANYVLIALCSLTLTYSLSHLIYTNILIPLKKEKIYLYSLLIGCLLNIGLSLLFGMVLFKNNPAIGVAIATSISDIFVFIFLVSFTWKYSKKMLFNLNNLKIVLTGIIITIISCFVSPIILDNLNQNLKIQISYIIEICIIFVSSFVIYLISMILLKEKLIRNVFFKKEY